MKKRSWTAILVFLMILFVLAGCGVRENTGDKGGSGKVTQSAESGKGTEKKKTKKEPSGKKQKDTKQTASAAEPAPPEHKAELNVTRATISLVQMSEALSRYLWCSMMSRLSFAEHDVDFDLKLSDAERIRAAVLASDRDNVIDSTFSLKNGSFVEDKNADTGPMGEGYGGYSVAAESVEENCRNLFGTEADWDQLQTRPDCYDSDAVKYTDAKGTCALIVWRDVENESDMEYHESSVFEENGRYYGQVKMFWGYWGELARDPGLSNYMVTYTLEADDASKYGMIITGINIKTLDNDQDTTAGAYAEPSAQTYTEAQAIQSATDYGTEDGEAFYGLWLAAFTREQDALDLVNKLREKGLEVYSIYTPDYENLNKKPFWCVTLGRSATEAKARSLMETAGAAGYKDAYVKYSGEKVAY